MWLGEAANTHSVCCYGNSILAFHNAKIHNYVTIVTCVVNGAVKIFMLNRALKK